MKFHSLSRTSAHFYAICMVIATILLFASISPAFGQEQERSEDRDKPTPIASKELSDDLDGSDDEYFYQFSAGPGKLTVTFEVKASGTNARAYLDLFGVNSRSILSNVLAQGVDRGSERVVKSVRLGRQQNIIMRIKGIRYGDSGGTGVYKVRLDGAVSFKESAPPNNKPDAADASRSTETGVSFAGVWETVSGNSPFTLTLQQTGDKVTGTYTPNNGQDRRHDHRQNLALQVDIEHWHWQRSFLHR